MLYLRGRGILPTRGGTLQQKIEVCGQQLVSSGGDQQIAALSNCSAVAGDETQQLTSASKNQTVWVWDAATGAARQTLGGHTGPVRTIAF
ncbi:hypothetical protein O988_00575 [Pseudogymnoascus sp. VKM F-3808]|nr:hypothetical protein O988_00575 [Pseudogymnoascus sp. VKM F-3808]